MKECQTAWFNIHTSQLVDLDNRPLTALTFDNEKEAEEFCLNMNGLMWLCGSFDLMWQPLIICK